MKSGLFAEEAVLRNNTVNEHNASMTTLQEAVAQRGEQLQSMLSEEQERAQELQSDAKQSDEERIKWRQE